MSTETHELPASVGALAELEEIQEILLSDVKEFSELLTKQNSEFLRRGYVRAVFAYIEGTVFSLKQVAFIDADTTSVNLTRAEIAFLLEESYQLTDTGKTEIRPNYGVRISPDVRFVFNIVARIYKFPYELKVDDSGWSSFREALEIRNYLTHPKDCADTVVSPDDLQVVSKAFVWFQHNYTLLLLGVLERLSQRVRKVE